MEDHNIYQEPTNPFSTKFEIRRRDFFKLLGAGIYIYFQLGDSMETLAADTQQRRTLPTDYNAFLHISEEGNVSGFSGKIEMGQGIITSLAQMLADELDVAIDKVKMVLGDTQLCPWDAGTWGSLTTRQFGPFFVAAAAEARAVLMTMGAEALKVSPDKVSTANGTVFVTGQPDKKISYADLTKGKRIEKFLTEKPKVKDFSEYKIRGTSFNRVDGELKVTGKALYAGDYRMPGMLYAKILRPPSHGATLVSADTSTAEKQEGVTIIRDKDMIAVLHPDPEKAEKALATIKADYSFDEKKVDDKSIFKYMLDSNPQGRETNKKGDLASGRGKSAHLFESEFYNSYVAHAPIEPHTALAWTEGNKIIIRASTQTPYPIQDSVARDLGVPLEDVRVITPFVGGGFGGKGAFRQANEAARLAKLSGKPVMLQWTRREEFFYDTFRPAAVVKINSGIDKEGNITLWDFNEYFAGSRGSDTIYDVPDQRTTSYSANNVHPFGTGAWRAPANNTNSYARESQIDMMASKAGMDPIAFRLKNLKDERMLRVVKALAEFINWKPAVSPSGRGYGIACGFDAGGYVATMAEVKVDRKTGHVEVVRVACVQEIGFCINPVGATMQMEGCITMGLGYALTEEVAFAGGDVKTHNFGTYEIPKFSWLPKIETKIIDMKTPPQGGGEPAIIVMGGVIANAVFDAVGARVYQLPMTPERILAALPKK